MKVLICGGPKNGKIYDVSPQQGEVQFCVSEHPVDYFCDELKLNVRPNFETVTNRINLTKLILENGRECTFVLAITDEAMKNMSISKWLELLSTAYEKGCIH